MTIALPRPAWHRGLVRGALLVCCAAFCAVAPAAGDDSANALRGLTRLAIAIEGVPADFARYGLTAAELERQVEERLTAAGFEIVDAAHAQADAAVGQLRIKLTTVTDLYAYYSYALSAAARRKLPLAPDGSAWVSQEVWQQGVSGILNPSDLKRVYGLVDDLIDAFIAAHDAHNAGSGTALAPAPGGRAIAGVIPPPRATRPVTR
jgi:hypothetical protein